MNNIALHTYFISGTLQELNKGKKKKKKGFYPTHAKSTRSWKTFQGIINHKVDF
jgi:hypothetical protein